jgi:hypothetical protein
MELAAQLTNAEWLASFPGSDDQKASVRGCAHCHTLELVTRSRHDAAKFVGVIERMSGYPPLSFPLMVQKTPAPRVGGGPTDRARQQQAWQRQAEYLSTLNLSGWTGADRSRSSEGRAAGLYRIRPAAADAAAAYVIVDSRPGVGAAFGEQILASSIQDRRDHRVSGAGAEAGGAKGSPACASTPRESVAGDAVPGRHREIRSRRRSFKRGAAGLNGDHVQINEVSPERQGVDGKVWLQDAGTYTLLRLDKVGQV